jgi:proteasome accessory factor A
MRRIVTDDHIEQARRVAPATTRANMRGQFIREAKKWKRDFTVDWVHLKLNDEIQRTILLKDPFKADDDRFQRLLHSLQRSEGEESHG